MMGAQEERIRSRGFWEGEGCRGVGVVTHESDK